jgi:signal transduction histidine kinase
VEVSLGLDGDHYVVDIVDDGKGMDPDRARSSHGIAGMRHRVETLGGRFTMSSSPGGGTRVSIRVPRASDATAR